jgi:CrcB protein
MGMNGFVMVGVGAALGAWLRWFLGVAMNASFPVFPLGTLVANLVGGYLIGLFIGLASTTEISPELRLFITTGFLGGLTTFSAFSGEAVSLLMRGEYGWGITHILAHVIGTLLMTALGIVTINLVR